MSTPRIVQTSIPDMTVGVAANVQLTAEAVYPSEYELTFRYENTDGGFDTASLPITLTNAAPPAVSEPSITTLALPDGEETVAYSNPIAVDVDGGTPESPAFTISAGSLPTGLSIDGASGLISGTPSAVGAYTFTVRYENTDGGFAERNYRVDVSTAEATFPSYTTWRDNAILFGDWRYTTGDPASGTALWQRNYYDRGYHWYFLNDATFTARADEQLVEEWNVYYHPNSYNIPPRAMHPDGYVEYYLRNGDVGLDGPVLVGLEAMAWYMTQFFIEKGYTDTGTWEGRIQERALLCTMAADAMNVPGQRKDYRAAAKRCFDGIVSTQNVVGSTYNGSSITSTSHPMYGSWTPPSSAYTRLDGLGQASTNFMAVQAMASMIRYVEYYDAQGELEAGARQAAIDACSAGCDWLWETQWSDTEEAFNYFSHQTTNGGPSPSAALNGLFPEVWGWLYNQTGGVKWREQGDQIFAKAATDTYGFTYSPGAMKQYNQSIRGLWRYIYWRDNINITHMLNPTEVHTP